MIHKQDLLDWRADVTVAASRAMNGRLPLEDAVVVDARFYVQRPKSAARSVLWPVKRPDLDKLARGVLDALVFGGVLGDDSQVVELRASKHFAGTESALPTPGVTVTITAA